MLPNPTCFRKRTHYIFLQHLLQPRLLSTLLQIN